VTWGGTTLHIIGLGINEHDPGLKERLAEVRAGRIRRAEEMGSSSRAWGSTARSKARSSMPAIRR